MADPVFELTLFGGQQNLAPLSYTHQGTDGLKMEWGYPPAMQLAPLAYNVLADGVATQWGYPVALQLNMRNIPKASFPYNFQFFYPSNGKVPGSPIPTRGQLLPRPI